jgi:hypothetical protein
MIGWVKLHRALIDWEWYKTPNMVQFWIHCLLRANHTDGQYQGISLKAGQFISGRIGLSRETGLSEQEIRTCISRLKSTNELTTLNMAKNTLFTINSWNLYQCEEVANQHINQLPTSFQPASNQLLTTNKNVNNSNNDDNSKKINTDINTCDKPKKEKTTASKFLRPTQTQIESFCIEHSLNVDAVHFFNYYEANGWKVGKNAMKSWGATLRYWSRQNELKTNARAVSEPRKNKMQEMEDWNMKILKEIEDEFNAKYPK